MSELTRKSAQKTKKNKDLIIFVDKKEGSNISYAPGCILVESGSTLVVPVVSGFLEKLAHELIHMKHYLEEQFFKEKSLREIAEQVDNPDFGDFSALGFTSKEDAFSRLMESSAVRNSVFRILKKPIAGDGNLIWTMPDLLSLPLLAYSVAGGGIVIANDAALKLLPEGKYRTKELLKQIIGDLEERRTVLGPDRDGITENTIRLEVGLPLRYIYQNAMQPMFELSDTIVEILGKESITHIQKNSERWMSENRITKEQIEIYKKQAMSNPLSIYKK